MTQEDLKQKYGDTLIMGVDAKTILPLLTGGFNPPDDAIADAIECNLKPMLRCEAELNPVFKQIIPYIILMNMDGRIFTTLRLGGDERLKGQHSIGLGGHMDGGKNEKWMTLLRDYMINHHINHTFWGLNPNSGDTGGLLSYDFMTWDTEKYDMFKESLWQTQETGKFIGLDHQKALGTDGSGISVSEFYKSYASTEGSNLDGGTIVNGSTTKPTTEPTKPSTTTTTTITTTAATTTEAPITEVIGDIDGDKELTVSDAVLLNRYLLRKIDGKDAAYTFERGDLNKDGVLNIVDAIAYKQYLSGNIAPPEL